MNATLLQQHLRSATGTTVSTQTVRNRLHGVGLYARRPMECVRLTSRHRRDRREWATEHVNWRRIEWSNVIFSDESRRSSGSHWSVTKCDFQDLKPFLGDWKCRPKTRTRLTSRHRRDRREWATEHVNWRRIEWSNVIFSDESRFSVHPNNRRIFIWRECGSRNNSASVHESVRFGGGGVLVYGSISIDGRTDLYIIRDGPLTGRRYSDEILRPIVVHYAAAIGDDFILMDDNCRPHRANLVEDFLFEEGIVRMEWPASSPDMNPIECVWDALGRRVAGHQPPPQTLQELERALLEE
ncbi:transposable element Tcb1 transposase [Trichonephila clavipes]|nr:transposable element Tcb1 transposase [Trichonephila clavipes]